MADGAEALHLGAIVNTFEARSLVVEAIEQGERRFEALDVKEMVRAFDDGEERVGKRSGDFSALARVRVNVVFAGENQRRRARRVREIER